MRAGQLCEFDSFSPLFVPWRTMNVPSRELTPEDLELIEFARRIVDAPDS